MSPDLIIMVENARVVPLHIDAIEMHEPTNDYKLDACRHVVFI